MSENAGTLPQTAHAAAASKPIVINCNPTNLNTQPSEYLFSKQRKYNQTPR
ncbi:hypothetical protein HpSP79_15340 [Helicobacter pylori]